MKLLLTLVFCLATAVSCISQQVNPQSPVADSTEQILIELEEPPMFPGGNAAKIKFLQDNIRYPQKARRKRIQGTVYVSFIVEKSGQISNVKVIRGIGGGCDEETVRVIKMMPPWIPGKHMGKAERVQFTMPMKYTLADDSN